MFGEGAKSSGVYLYKVLTLISLISRGILTRIFFSDPFAKRSVYKKEGKRKFSCCFDVFMFRYDFQFKKCPFEAFFGQLLSINE